MTRNHDDIQLAPASAPMPPPILPSTIARGSVQIETEHEDVVPPPRNASLYWAFTHNVFQFPFRLYSLTQWIISSLGLAASAECTVLSVMGFLSMSMAGALQGGVFGIAACILSIFSLSYLTGCFIDIAVNAAHNIDKASDWPNPDHRERLLAFIRAVWTATLAGTMAAGGAAICALAGDVFYITFFPLFGLLFPILLLAGLEADSLFWPVSWPIFRSLRRAWHAWVMFYLISGALGFACGLVSVALFNYSALQMPLVAGPLWATAIFIYGRLLGRLAWFILHKVDRSLGNDSRPRNKAQQRLSEQQRWNI
jgi:hypothetical protein